MVDFPLIPPWTQSGWLEMVSAWAHTELDHLGISVTGPMEETQTRPWSIVLHMPTPAGLVFFKASAAILLYEAAVTQALAQLKPDCMPEILAIDDERGWMLMQDGGPRLREILKEDRDLEHWEKLLPSYAADRCGGSYP